MARCQRCCQGYNWIYTRRGLRESDDFRAGRKDMKSKLASKIVYGFAQLLAVAAIQGCASQDVQDDGVGREQAVAASPERAAPEADTSSAGGEPLSVNDLSAEMEFPRDANSLPRFEEIQPGGLMFNSAAASRAANVPDASGETILNFEATDVRKVIRTVLGDILGKNFAIDPAVKGDITLQSSRPVAREALIPMLETVLRLNGLILSDMQGTYVVVPDSANRVAGKAPRLRLSSQAGYQVLIVPMRYVAAAEMKKVLELLKPEKVLLEADEKRNVLLMAGTQMELTALSGTVAIYDVNQLKGNSIGIFRMEYAQADTVREELEKLLGAGQDGPLLDGMLKFVTLERLNALVVITPQKRYLEDVREWVERLDYVEAEAGRNMYVLPVQHGRASYLAEMLGQLFTSDRPAGNGQGSGSGPTAPSPMRAATGGTGEGAAMSGSATSKSASVNTGGSGVKIVADEKNNALLILAAREDYQKLKALIRQIDVVPMQVLVEASIMEVRLGDELSYGLQWFFSHNSGDYEGGFELFPSTVEPTFRYTLVDTLGDFKAVLDMLAADSRLDVLSSPSLMVQDNETASIHVGQQVPIRTSETTSLNSSGVDPLVTSTIQYRDTGVKLEVRPRVNAGGMVSLEITQQVDGVDETTTSTIDSPTIFQRKITTNVAVESGQTIVLGGLITESTTTSNAGVPILRSMPGVGALFSSQKEQTTRTELLVVITPTAIANAVDALSATREMQKKMSKVFEK